LKRGSGIGDGELPYSPPLAAHQRRAAIVAKRAPRRGECATSLHLNTAFYFATFVEFPAMAWLAKDQALTDAAKVVWSSRAMFESLGLVAIFTMGFVCCLAFFSVRQARQLT
jgi:hypothetical protein